MCNKVTNCQYSSPCGSEACVGHHHIPYALGPGSLQMRDEDDSESEEEEEEAPPALGAADSVRLIPPHASANFIELDFIQKYVSPFSFYA